MYHHCFAQTFTKVTTSMAHFRCLHIVIVGAIGAAILTVTIVCVSGHCKRSTGQATVTNDPVEPAAKVIPPRNGTAILEYLNDITLQDVEIKTGVETPKKRAATWLISEDALPLYPDNTDSLLMLRQRYALASLWFQQDTPWGDADGWLGSTLSECEWEGVECDSPNNPMEITKLSLCCININGNLPVDLGLLTALTSFDVGRNSLSGSIPTEYSAAWSRLKEFFIGDNDFTGMIPDPKRWNELEIFDVHANQFSTGTESIEWPTTLRTMYLYNNTLTGDLNALCDNVDNMKNLARLVADCDKVQCDCCTECCPNATAYSC